MKFMTEYPLHSDDGGAWVEPETMISYVQALEHAGIDAVALTDHPAPSAKWLAGGGHETLDPFAGLTFFAGVTKRLQLMTNLVVVPYRNPLLMAKSMVTVDLLSGGRAIYALGTGYLRSEFAGLGVDIEERNALFDEALDVLDKVWTRQPVDHEGTHFTARGAIFKPGHVREPRPPLWIGGNSTLTLKRVAARADGWSAMVGPPIIASTARTPSISTLEELAARIADLRGRIEANGRAVSDITISAGSPSGATNLANDQSVQQRIDGIQALATLGVSWSGVHMGNVEPAKAIEAVHRFAADVLPHVR